MSKARLQTIEPTHAVLLNRKTGRPVGPAVPIVKDDYPLKTLNRSEVLWKYMDLWKFEKMLKTSSLYFRRADQLSDPFEGRLSVVEPHQFSRSDRAVYGAWGVDRDPAEAALGHNQFRSCGFLSCWHRNSQENPRMWRAYTGSSDSVAIKTSVNAIDRFVPNLISKSPVLYHERETSRSEVFGWITVFFYKPSEYTFEREYRLLRHLEKGESVNSGNPEEFGKEVVVRLRKIVQQVVMHPLASDEAKRKTKMLIENHLKGVRLVNSCLRC